MGTDPAALRDALVHQLSRSGAIRSPAVAAAFRTVPRHVFLPGMSLEAVYRDDAIIIRRAAGGLPTSSSSQPSIMAVMIEQAELRPGHRVLEVGAGTGYNAALLREIVGGEGRVVTVDIQADLVVETQTHLREAGYADIEVVAADGGFGHAPGAPYDRIMLTASVSDLSPHWREQLVEGGILVLPLRLRTQGLSVAFERQGDVLTSRSVTCSGFMQLRGAFGHGDDVVEMGDGLFLCGPRAPEVPLDLLASLLAEIPRRLTGLIVPVNSFGLGGGLGIYLALQEPGVIDVFATHPERWGFHALSGLLDVEARSLCLIRPDGVVVYGTDAAGERVLRRAAEWVAMDRPGVERLRVDAYPAGQIGDRSGRWLVRGRWADLVVWFEERTGESQKGAGTSQGAGT